MDALKALFKQPYWVIALILGTVMIVLPCVTIDKDYHFSTHPPSTLIPVVVGSTLLVLSIFTFVFSLWTKHLADRNAGLGVDLTRVSERDGAMWTTMNGCEIRVVYGRIQDYSPDAGTVIVLPCNEYFDDQCAADTKSALGAYVSAKFEGQIERFVSLMKGEAAKKLGPGSVTQKTNSDQAKSFGAGRCVLLVKPLDCAVPVAVVSTTTQRAGEGLAARISYLFDGMRELFAMLADARLTEVAMPVLGAGHGRIDPPLALVGLLLAVAEAARYGQGGQRLRKVTIVVFMRAGQTDGEVDRVVVRRALALIGSQD